MLLFSDTLIENLTNRLNIFAEEMKPQIFGIIKPYMGTKDEPKSMKIRADTTLKNNDIQYINSSFQNEENKKVIIHQLLEMIKNLKETTETSPVLASILDNIMKNVNKGDKRQLRGKLFELTDQFNLESEESDSEESNSEEKDTNEKKEEAELSDTNQSTSTAADDTDRMEES